MSLLQRLATNIKAAFIPSAPEMQGPVGLLEGISTRSETTRSNVEFLRAYSTMPWLRAVTHRIADSIAAVEWHLGVVRRNGRARRMEELAYESPKVRAKSLARLKQVGELQEIDEHVLLTMIRRGNPALLGRTVRQVTQIYLDIWGEAYWLLERNGAGAPVFTWPLSPDWIKSLPTVGSPFYEASFGLWRQQIPASEVVPFCDPNPVNPYGRGSGTALALADELETDEFAAKHTKAWFLNGALPLAIVSPDDGQAANPTALRQLKQTWREEHQGFWRAFKIFFSTRKVSVEQLSHTFADQQLIELRQHERDTIMQVFGVPPEIVGVLSSSNRATITEAQQIYGEQVLTPRLEYLREAMQELLVPQYDDRLILWYDSPIQADRDYQLRVMQARPLAFSANDWREQAELDRRDDGEVFHLPLNVAPQETLGGLPARNGRRAIKSIEQKQPLHVDEAPLDDFYTLVHRVADRLEPAARRAWLTRIRQVRSEIDLALLQSVLTRGDVTAAVDAIPWGRFEALIGELFRDVFEQAIEQGGVSTLTELQDELGITFEYNVPDLNAQQFAERQAGTAVTRITESAREAVRRRIVEAFQEPIQPDTLARELQEIVGLHPDQVRAVERFRQALLDAERPAGEVARRTREYAEAQLRRRGEVIMRTELITSASAGQQQAWELAQREGFLDEDTTRRIWIVTPDDRLDLKVCEPIPSMNPNGVGLREPFQTPVGPLMFPSAHPQCRCVISLRFLD